MDRLSFDVRPGTVTGFLGPNGAGKSTTMRMIVGLDRPDAGSALIGGRPYADLRWPLREVGAMVESKSFAPGRSARAHLAALAAGNRISPKRVEEVLDLTGLTSVAGRRAGKFSLGMAQRLGIAAALLGDPRVLILDEPVNGLDPEGIRWIRDLMKSLAGQGRTVLVSSHLIGEVALAAADLVVIGRGRLLAQTTVARAVLLGGAYLFLVALCGLGLGAVARHAAAGVAVLVGLLFALPLIVRALPHYELIMKFLPEQIAANSLTAVKPVPGALSPWAGLAMMCLYTAAMLAVGYFAFTRRDA